VSTFSTPIPHGTVLVRQTPSAPAPGLRFAGDPLMWIGVPSGTVIAALATGAVARAEGAGNGVPGNAGAAWTLFQLSPLPQMNQPAFARILGGLPVQLVVVTGTAGPTPANDDCLAAGAPLVTAPAGPGSTAFVGVALQDRLCRDPLTWAEAIAATGACDGTWAQFVSDFAALPNARNLRILDATGAPLANGQVSVAIDGNAPAAVALAGSDGDTGVAVPPGSRAAVVFTSAAHPIVAAGDRDLGAFEGGGLQLPADARMAQVVDADLWLATPDPGVQVQRWNPDSFMEPIQEGTPYFARLVEDLRAAEPNGAAELAGWAFVKGSQADSTIDWQLVPGDAHTTVIGLIDELVGQHVDVGMLVNRFMQFDSATLDDFPELAPILFALYTSLSPLQALLSIQTDPAGYLIGFIAVAALTLVLASGVTLDMITSAAEYSKPLMDALSGTHPGVATWTPYPAAFPDNPLVTPPPFTVLGHTIDDLSHLGVYHQKYVNIKAAAGGLVSYLGGIDINSDRPDTTIHRARHPFHDVQVRVTGPAVIDVIRSYAERATLHAAPIPIAVPAAGSVGPAGSHLVQIARTYFKPGAGSATSALAFAPQGESTPVRTIKAAMAQARDFIYIEDQYFTPPDDYVQALIAAAGNGASALFITVPYQTDQPYGGQRRADVLNALQVAWGDRLLVGTPLRRFLHETPALTTNLGRMRLAADMTATAVTCSVGPLSHIPAPPFWAFIGGEMVLVHALTGGPSGSGSDSRQDVEIVRASGAPGWGAAPVAHPAGTPVLAIQVPGIYVHAKVMVVDDVFLFAGSSNINRRGLYHDGEMNSFTIPQHLAGDASNPVRLLRTRLMAEHMGLSPEMGQALFADPISAIPYLTRRSWYQGAHRQSLDFFGSLPPDVSLGTSDTVGGWLLGTLIGALREAAMADVWPLLADPTTSLDPSPASKGPHFP
jgi:phosphatidylserine/phosphatidylglycerophosphate/cardiolipin synthase-like enzyme